MARKRSGFVCSNCYVSLQNYFAFISKYLKTENNWKNFKKPVNNKQIKTEGPNGGHNEGNSDDNDDAEDSKPKNCETLVKEENISFHKDCPTQLQINRG